MYTSLGTRKQSFRAIFYFSIETGITFEQSSNLELQPPPAMEELAVNTQIEFYFNVTQSDVGDDRAFLCYLGNEEGTHT